MGFFDSITGKSQKDALHLKARQDRKSAEILGGKILGAHDDFAQSQETGQQYVIDSYDDALASNQQGFDQSIKYYNPYIEQGQGAHRRLGEALGVHGDAVQNDFYTEEQNSPGFQAGLNAGVDALMSRYAATNTGRVGEDGLPRSGRVLKGLQDYGNRYLNDYVDRKLGYLGSMSNQGYNASQNASGITNDFYKAQGNLNLGQGQAYNQYYQVPGQTRLTGKLGEAQAEYKGRTGYSSGLAQGNIAKSNAINNLFTQGLSIGSKALGAF